MKLVLVLKGVVCLSLRVAAGYSFVRLSGAFYHARKKDSMSFATVLGFCFGISYLLLELMNHQSLMLRQVALLEDPSRLQKKCPFFSTETRNQSSSGLLAGKGEEVRKLKKILPRVSKIHPSIQHFGFIRRTIERSIEVHPSQPKYE